MTFLVIKTWLLGLVLCGCAGGPDEFELGYGHIWQGDSSLEGWNLANDDSDMVTVGLVWKLKPTEVVVRNPYGDEAEITSPPDLRPPQDVAEEDLHPTAADHVGQDVSEAVHTFNEMDWLTRVLLIVAVCWLGWVYRERLGRLIPGGKNGKK